MVENNLPYVWIIIPTWNRGPDLVECIKSLKSQTYENIDIVVIDNGSEDDTVNLVKNQYSEIQLLELGKNYGASYATNQGFKFALSHNADLIFRLDSDTILAENYLELLVEFLNKEPDAGIVSGRIFSYYQPEKIIYPGGDYWKWNLSPKYFDQLKNLDIDDISPKEVKLLPSTGMLITRKTIERLKGFDEDYLVYYEDFDFCLRAVKSKIKLYMIPQARIWHKVFSQKKSDWIAIQWNRSKMIFYRKHAHNGFHKLFMIVYAFLYALVRSFIKDEERGNKGPTRSAFKGLINGLFTHLA